MSLLLLLNSSGDGIYVVSFTGYTPSPRYDNEPWTQIKIEEAPAKDGSWTELVTATLNSPDADPANPQSRDITLTGATLAAGWYRITFLDAEGNQQPTRPIFNGANITPSLDQVADLLRTYVKDDVGEVATFTANTKPSAQQVEAYIGHGLRRVRSKLGPIYKAAGDYEELADDATHAVALYAAAMAVLARTPEQQAGSNSHYSNLKDLFDEALTDLDKAAEEVGAGEDIGGVDDRALPVASFPAPGVSWDTEIF